MEPEDFYGCHGRLKRIPLKSVNNIRREALIISNSESVKLVSYLKRVYLDWFETKRMKKVQFSTVIYLASGQTKGVKLYFHPFLHERKTARHQ